MEENQSDLLVLTSEVVAAYVANNRVSASDLTSLIRSIHASFQGIVTPQMVDAAHQVKPTPAVPIRKSVSADAIICLEDGKSFKSLRRHLRAKYNMSPEEYRERWGLPDDYPMVAPNYTAQRSAHAKKLGLGQMQRTANKGAPSKSRTAARQ